MSEDDYWYLKVPASVCEWKLVSEVLYVGLWGPTGVLWRVLVSVFAYGCVRVHSVVSGYLLVSDGAYECLSVLTGV